MGNIMVAAVGPKVQYVVVSKIIYAITFQSLNEGFSSLRAIPPSSEHTHPHTCTHTNTNTQTASIVSYPSCACALRVHLMLLKTPVHLVVLPWVAIAPLILSFGLTIDVITNKVYIQLQLQIIMAEVEEEINRVTWLYVISLHTAS